MAATLFMVVEHYRNQDPSPVYRRYHSKGRMMPEGLEYVSSWVDESLAHCYQLMKANDRELLDEWLAKWSDIVDFEVHVVITSQQAAERVQSRLESNATPSEKHPAT